MTVPGLDAAGPAGPAPRVAEVLGAAMLTFARFGYRRTSMEEVARAAEISRPGLYFHFASKRDLFRAAVTWTLERDLAAVAEALAADAPLAQRLGEAFDRWAGRYLGPAGRDITRVVDDNPGLLGAIADAAPDRFEVLIVEAIAADAERSPGGSPASPRAVAQTLISISVGLKHQVDTREQYGERLAVAIGLLVPGRPGHVDR